MQRFFILFLFFAGSTFAQALECNSKVPNWWKPAGKLRWYTDYSGSIPSASKNVDVVVLSLNTVIQNASEVEELRKAGKKVVCYTNSGALEDGHWDMDLLKATLKKFNLKESDLIGKQMEGYEGERWLNIRQLKVMEVLVEARFKEALAAGCDAVDPDNVEAWITGQDGGLRDLYRSKGMAAVIVEARKNVKSHTSFDISYNDQLAYNELIANIAHRNCLAIDLKNDVYQIDKLASTFDFAVNEQCHHCKWCDFYKPFVKLNKPVFGLEYFENEEFCGPGSPEPEVYCKEDVANNYTTFSVLKKQASSKLHLPGDGIACNAE